MFRRAKEAGKLSHAYLFWGYGSPASRLEVAMAIAHLFEIEPFVDCRVVESVSIDDVRNATRFLSQRPFKSEKKILVIANLGGMADTAQNALLKTVEEPPQYGLVLACVRDPELVLPALRSRFQKIYIPAPAWHDADIVSELRDSSLAREFIQGNNASRKELLKQLVTAEDIPLFERFAHAVMAELMKEPIRNMKALRELSRRIAMMAESPLNRRLQWEAVSSYL